MAKITESFGGGGFSPLLSEDELKNFVNLHKHAGEKKKVNQISSHVKILTYSSPPRTVLEAKKKEKSHWYLGG